jgi:hypothetical protein
MAWYWIVAIVLGAILLWIVLSAALMASNFVNDKDEAVALGIILPVSLILVLIFIVGKAAERLSKIL